MSPEQAPFLSGDDKSLAAYAFSMSKGRTPLALGEKELRALMGQRLALLADLHAMSAPQMEECLGLSHGHWRLIASGSRPLSIGTAIRICEQFEVTIDWILRGVPASQVQADVLVNLVALRPELTVRRSKDGGRLGTEPADKAA